MNYEQDDLPDRLADDYVLGALRGPARRRFERLARASRTFREARQKAEARWNRLAESLPEMQPSAATWQAINRRINPAPTSERPKYFGLWRGWAIASTLLLAVALGAFWSLPPATSYVAVIVNDANSAAGWLISLQPDGRAVRVEALAPQPIADDRVFELWVKAPDLPRVRSVGLIPPAGQAVLPLPEELGRILARAELFGVSVEPPGGSPTGQPTSEPLFHGRPRSI